MKGKAFIFLIFSAISLIFLFPFNPCPSLAAETPLEDAILRGNWESVFEILSKDENKADDPVARMVMGHTCLATNRNNASMLLFMSVKEENQIKKWSEWTEYFLAKNPQNPVALYFSSDSDVRLGNFQKAINKLSDALKAKRDFALALTTRGVIRVLDKQLDEGLIDLTRAVQIDPKLADAHANLGNCCVIMDAADGALEAFDKAINHNSEFALAYNGRGCAYFGKGEFDKAVADFSMAYLLCPVLSITEINQGFASLYATPLVALGGMGKKPGTTLEFRQQYNEINNERIQNLSKNLPGYENQEFWRKIENLPNLSSDQRSSLVQEYGLQSVQAAASIKIGEYNRKITQNLQDIQKDLTPQIGPLNNKIQKLWFAETILSLGGAATGTISDMKKGPEYTRLGAESRVTQSYAAANIKDRGWQLYFKVLPGVIDPLVGNVNPISAAGTAVGVIANLERYEAENRRLGVGNKITFLNAESSLLAAKIGAMKDTLITLQGGEKAVQTNRSQNIIPGYYTSTDRSISEVGALASMVDKGIKGVPGLPRSALIVSEDPFRSKLLQSELSGYGFQTKIVLPESDFRKIGNEWGANVILGIKRTSENRVPQTGQIPFQSGLSPQKYYESDSIKKYPPFPPPPDGGGGGGGGGGSGGAIPARLPSPISSKVWDYGKSFVPPSTKGAPGGVSTEELAKSFVDRGNWPVLTSFGLLYGQIFLPEGLKR